MKQRTGSRSAQWSSQSTIDVDTDARPIAFDRTMVPSSRSVNRAWRVVKLIICSACRQQTHMRVHESIEGGDEALNVHVFDRQRENDEAASCHVQALLEHAEEE